MLKLSLGTGFLKRVGQIHGVAELKSGASSLKTPWKMVNHHTRIIAVVDNIVIMRYHEHSSHHSRETRASLDSLKLPLIPGANVQPLQLHFALQRPEGSRLH